MQEARIAIHCHAGMGRAPTLVALALMKFGGLSGVDAIKLIRNQRPKCFNSTQVNFLIDFNPRELRVGESTGCCFTRSRPIRSEGSRVRQSTGCFTWVSNVFRRSNQEGTETTLKNGVEIDSDKFHLKKKRVTDTNSVNGETSGSFKGTLVSF